MASAIDLIVNRTARMYQRDARTLARVREVASARCRLHVSESLAELSEIAAGIAGRGSDLVLLSGGDGSVGGRDRAGARPGP